MSQIESNLTDGDRGKIGIYLLHNKTTNEVYIGSGDINKRNQAHSRNLNKNKHINYKLQKSFNKKPDFEFIGISTEIKELSKKENREIALELEQVFFK